MSTKLFVEAIDDYAIIVSRFPVAAIEWNIQTQKFVYNSGRKTFWWHIHMTVATSYLISAIFVLISCQLRIIEQISRSGQMCLFIGVGTCGFGLGIYFATVYFGKEFVEGYNQLNDIEKVQIAQGSDNIYY